MASLGIAASVLLWKTLERRGVLTELAPLNPDNSAESLSWAAAISRTGRVVGWSDSPRLALARPVVWDGGQSRPSVLPLPRGARGARPIAVSQNGRFLVGDCGGDSQAQATLWGPQGASILSLLPYAIVAEARGVDSAGRAVGNLNFGDEEPRARSPYRGRRAALWTEGEVTLLDPDARGEAFALNDAGLIVGDSAGLPVVWRKGQKLVLKGGRGLARAVSPGGIIGGSVAGKPVVWQSLTSAPRRLSCPQGTAQAEVWAVNDRDQAVGVVFDPKAKAPRGAYWEDGAFRDPSTLIPAGSNFRELFPVGLDSRGQLVGVGYTTGDELRGFIYTP